MADGSLERVGAAVATLAQRRAALRSELVRGVVVRRRRRLAVKVLALAGIVALLVPWPVGPGRPASPLRPPIAPRDPYAVVIVRDSDDVVARLRIAVEPRAVALDDDGLLAALRGMGRTVGLARVGGRLVVPGLVLDPLP